MSENPTKQCTKCKEIKGLIEFPKRADSKDGLRTICKPCTAKGKSIYYITHKEERNAYLLENKEKRDAYNIDYYSKNKEKVSEVNADYYKNHREERVEYKKAYVKLFPGKVNALNMKRHATKLRATPSWLTEYQLKQIEAIYVEAAKLTRDTGIRHEVDHIIPLQGKTVTGLHVPWNLQILTKIENISKGNKLIQS